MASYEELTLLLPCACVHACVHTYVHVCVCVRLYVCVN